MINKTYRIALNEIDLGQLIDGLESRARAWEQTANYHLTGESPSGFIVEECTDADEASRIAEHFQSIIANIQNQRKAQP